jgi:hypothetical protein
MNKEILKQVLLEITKILSKQEYLKEASRTIDRNKTKKQFLHSLETRTNEVCKKYDKLQDLIKQI